MPIPRAADPASLGFDPDRLARLGPWMRRYIEAGRIPGAQVLIARQGQIAWEECAGQRDVERELPWEPDTIARFYSMTKPITSTALMMLYEQALVSLDDPVDAYIPAFADRQVLWPRAGAVSEVEPARTRMTLRHLMTHTSGLTYGFQPGLLAESYRDAGVDFSVRDGTLAETVAKLAEMPLAFEPGSRWNYSVSTDVLGHVVEIVSGQPLDRFFAEHILGPLGMEDTFFGVPEAKQDRMGAHYQRTEDDGMKLVEDCPGTQFRAGEVTQFSGGGGLLSTAADYLRFAEMQRQGGSLDGVRILGPRTMSLMASNHLPGDLASMGQKVWAEVSFEGIGFGLGGWVMLDPARAQTLGSPGDYGWGGMASTVYWVDPAEELVVIFLTQLSPSSSYPVRKELRALVYSALTD